MAIMITEHREYPELAKKLGLEAIYFKREDLHPYGSHKGRSIPIMMDRYVKDGDLEFAISSSGNAAIAAARHAKNTNTARVRDGLAPITLDIFVSNNISDAKLQKISLSADKNTKILQTERPLQTLNEAINAGKRSLRQSTDDLALVGYKILALELSEIPDIGSVFIGTSSGTTAQALAEYFSTSTKPVQVHIVQTSSCYPMIGISVEGLPEERSIADAIVDRTTHRKNVLIPLIEKTGGRGWIATNADITMAMELAKRETGLQISTNSALSIVGAKKAKENRHPLRGAVVCMICGD